MIVICINSLHLFHQTFSRMIRPRLRCCLYSPFGIFITRMSLRLNLEVADEIVCFTDFFLNVRRPSGARSTVDAWHLFTTFFLVLVGTAFHITRCSFKHFILLHDIAIGIKHLIAHLTWLLWLLEWIFTYICRCWSSHLCMFKILSCSKRWLNSPSRLLQSHSSKRSLCCLWSCPSKSCSLGNWRWTLRLEYGIFLYFIWEIIVHSIVFIFRNFHSADSVLQMRVRLELLILVYFKLFRLKSCTSTVSFACSGK